MDQNDRAQFMTLSDASKNVPTLAKSRSALRLVQSTCSTPIAADCARILIGSYRRGEAEDREIFVGSIAAVLASYPEAVARRVTDPRTGVASRIGWLPNVAEVTAACEREMQPLRVEERRRLERERSRAILDSKVEVPAERRKQLAAELRQKMADLHKAVLEDHAARGPANLSEALRATFRDNPAQSQTSAPGCLE